MTIIIHNVKLKAPTRSNDSFVVIGTMQSTDDVAAGDCRIGCTRSRTRAFEVAYHHGVNCPIHAFDASNEMISEFQ